MIANEVTDEIYERKAPHLCPECDKKIVKGDPCVVVRDVNGRVKARFCSRFCQLDYKVDMLKTRPRWEPKRKGGAE